MKCHFKLLADLDLTGLHFYPIGDALFPYVYAGTFDGNGHTISHLTVKGEDYLGLFRRLASGADVKNLGVVDVNIAGSGGYIGGASGRELGCCDALLQHRGGQCDGTVFDCRRAGETRAP